MYFAGVLEYLCAEILELAGCKLLQHLLFTFLNTEILRTAGTGGQEEQEEEDGEGGDCAQARAAHCEERPGPGRPAEGSRLPGGRGSSAHTAGPAGGRELSVRGGGGEVVTIFDIFSLCSYW